MRVQTALLAESATVVNGMLNVFGGGYEYWRVSRLPWQGELNLALVVEASEGAQPGDSMALVFAIDHSATGTRITEGDALIPVDHGPVAPGAPVLLPVVAPLPVHFDRPGRHTVTVGDGTQVLMSLPLWVIESE